MDIAPPLDAAQSRHARAIFLAAASEIWLASKTFAAPLPPTTKSAGKLDLGAVAVTKRGTGALPGFGLGRGGRSSNSGATEGPITSVSALCAQISSLQTGTRGAEPPTPTAPINCLLTTIGNPPEFANSLSCMYWSSRVGS